MLIVLDDLIKLGKLFLLNAVELLADQQLGVDAVGHLFLELLDGSVHPVLVFTGCLQALG